MQAKIIDFASDKIAKKLNKIDKNDVKSAVESVKDRWLNRKLSDKNSKSADNLNNVTSREEYCDMLKNEFKLDDKKVDEKQDNRLGTDLERIDGKKVLLRLNVGNVNALCICNI